MSHTRSSGILSFNRLNCGCETLFRRLLFILLPLEAEHVIYLAIMVMPNEVFFEQSWADYACYSIRP